MDHIRIVPEGEPICDFCSDPKVTANYHAHDFILPNSPGEWILGSEGDWAACSLCSKLIDTANWETLLQNAATAFYDHYPEARGVIPVAAMTAHLEATWGELRKANLKKTVQP